MTRTVDMSQVKRLQGGAQYLTPFERDFLDNLSGFQPGWSVSDKQVVILEEIEQKLGELVRYFFVVYYADVGPQFNWGNMRVESKGYPAFPSNEYLRKQAARQSACDVDRVIVISITEFRNEHDFKAFGV